MEINVNAVTASDTKDGFAKLAKYVDEIGKKLPREMSVVLNKTATLVASSTKQPLGIKQELQKLYASGFLARDIAKLIQRNKASKDHLKAVIKLKRKNRPSLSLFKPSFTKKGVTYRMLKNEGRKRIASGFDYKKKGLIARRATKKRVPLVFPKGVSPAVLFAGSSGQMEKTPLKIKFQLITKMEERIKFLQFKEAEKQGVSK